MLEFIKVNAKSIAAFVAGLILNALTAVTNGQVPWPKDLAEWGQYLGTSLIAGVMVWATGNKLTERQIVKEAVKQGVTVVTDTAIDVAATAAVGAVHEATSNLGPEVSVTVNKVAQQVSETVTDVLKGVSSNFSEKLL